MSERKNIVELWQRRPGGHSVLVTLVHAEGSSYRRPGARMLISSGLHAGTLSGGCLEAEVIQKASWIIRQGPKIERYSMLFDDTADVPFGLGCGGTVDLLFESTASPEGRALLEAMSRSLAGEAFTVVTFFPGGSRALRRLITDAAGDIIFRSLSISDEKIACARSLSPGQSYDGRFVEALHPPQRLFVLGAGDDAQPVVELAASVGFAVTVADGRPQFARPDRFPKAQRMLALDPARPALTGVPTVTTSITVTADAQTGAEIKPPTEAAKPPQPTATATTAAATPATVDLAGVEKSAIYKIHPDNTVETLFSSKEENVYDVLTAGRDLLFCTDASGRIYRLTAARKLTLEAQTNEGEIARLFRSAGAILAANGTGGKIYRLGTAPAAFGRYESPVYDAGSVARWGLLRWQGSGSIVASTRSGNSLRPDRTWSDWTSSPGQINSPNARFLQWRAELASGATLDSVSAGFLTQNNPPVVRSITALTTLQPTPAAAKANNNSSAATTPYTMTVTDTGDAGTSASTGTPTQTLSRAASQQLILTWQADDPDGDKLIYTLSFRGDGERSWKQLKDNLHENSWILDGDALADGRYWFRVTASDREVNPGSSAMEAELVSSPVLIDNTPPVLTTGPEQNGGLDFQATDATSSLRRCEYAIDGGPWNPLDPLEGILDAKSARFHVDLTKRPLGEHLLVLRAFDSGNNAGLAKVVLR